MAMDCSVSALYRVAAGDCDKGTARHRVTIVSDDVPHLMGAKVLAQRPTRRTPPRR